MSLLDITGEDISKLNDAELRNLIGLLCEAEFRHAGHSTKGITWGGSQDAPDGGLDVVVDGVESLSEERFVPKCFTGFQVKKPSMPPAAIKKEMSPNGALRDIIKKIGEEGGAYIIISSGDSTSNSALQNRVDAMNAEVQSLDDNRKPLLDFYDQGRIATWTRQHPSCTIWVWSKIGGKINGWLPSGNWSSNGDTNKDEYIIDDDLRLHNHTFRKDEGLTLEKGISILRSSLLPVKASVRLTGLSGVGKTRLCEALFDDRIGNDALNPSFVIYTDISFSPNPEPVAMAEELVATKSRAVLIIDNCSPELHRTLTKVCNKSGSQVSLLTVEYDIRDDLPDETEVFRLEPASILVIEKLIKKRFDYVSDVDARTISEFSGGNARVAIALAHTLKQDENLNKLRDEELFQRLFKQRNTDNEGLLKSAQICSLVYSFEGTDLTSEKSELKMLANLQGINPNDLYADISILRDRGLVQSRGVWRAILPHAIANRLAKQALNKIPRDLILQAIQTSSERLIKSFSRRLSYLHDEQVAVEMAAKWLNEDGWLGKSIQNFSYLEISVFKNIAPISPELTLESIERAANSNKGEEFTSRSSNYYNEFVQILTLIAYDKKLFHRSVEILVRFAVSENPEENYDSTRKVLEGLFQHYLSGTKATHIEKASIIDELLLDKNSIRNELGVLLMGSCLDTNRFSSIYPHQFGARSRDYGYQPMTEKEYNHWYEVFIHLCVKHGKVDSSLGNNVRRLFANYMREIIQDVNIFDIVDKAILDFHSECGWSDGWLAIKRILLYDKGKLGDKKNRLIELEKLLRPQDLESEIKAYILNSQFGHFDIIDNLGEGDDYLAKEKRFAIKAFVLGSELAKHKPLFEKLIMDLFNKSNNALLDLGKGFASIHPNLLEIWDILAKKSKSVDPKEINFLFMFGFLSYCDEYHNDVYNKILDKVLNDDYLKNWFPRFQCTGSVGANGLKRLHLALDYNSSYPWTYNDLSYGKAYSQLSDEDIALIVEKLRQKEGGVFVVLEIISTRFLRQKHEKIPYNKHIVDQVFKLLSNLPFEKSIQNRSMEDYNLAEIAEVCLDEQFEYATSDKICQHIFNSIEDNNLYPTHYRKLLQTVAKKQPIIFLDTLLLKNKPSNYRFRFLFRDSYEKNESPLNCIQDKILISWCDENINVRFPLILEKMSCFHDYEQRGLDWKPIVYYILIKAENKKSILRIMKNSIDPTSWSGSKTEILKKRIVLFDRLKNHGSNEVQHWALEQREKFLEYIQETQESEAARNRTKHESFE